MFEENRKSHKSFLICILNIAHTAANVLICNTYRVPKCLKVILQNIKIYRKVLHHIKGL